MIETAVFRVFARSSLMAMLVALSACGGGGGSSAAPDDSAAGDNSDLQTVSEDILIGSYPILDTQPVNNSLMSSCASLPAPNSASTITGTVRYARVPITNSGLNYSASVRLPVRAVVVQAVDASGGQCSESVVASALTNGAGEYGLMVPENLVVCVEVRAQMIRDSQAGGGGASWDIQVSDNSNSNAPYYLVDSRVATPSDEPLRDLFAPSGVQEGSSNYTGARAAAPFAILDSVCEALDTVVAVDSDVQLPLLHLRWSVNNIAVSGAIEEGEIGGAFFRKLQIIDTSGNVLGFSNEIFLLGDEGSNTDEYDPHVINHEMGHYIANALFRSDGFGGEHLLGDRLDMRTAFDEGWSDAFSAIALDEVSPLVLDEPKIYRDSLGVNQSQTFRFSMDVNGPNLSGWYSESSVYSVIYNLFDSVNDGVVDTLSLNFQPIYDTLSSSSYQSSDAMLSIFSFINQLKLRTDNDLAIDTLLAEENFESINDDFGSGEEAQNNDIAFRDDVEPIYTPLVLGVGGTVCSNNQFGLVNKLSVTQFLQFDATENRNYTITVDPVTGSFSNGQAILDVFQRGSKLATAAAASPGAQIQRSLQFQGIVVLALYDSANGDVDAVDTSRRCFVVTVE